jgi:hypothetical protein
MTPDQALINAVSQAIADAWAWPSPSWEDVARAAIAAVQAAECCSVCGAQLLPPVICDVCAAGIGRNEVPHADADKTPVVVTDRRAPR